MHRVGSGGDERLLRKVGLRLGQQFPDGQPRCVERGSNDCGIIEFQPLRPHSREHRFDVSFEQPQPVGRHRTAHDRQGVDRKMRVHRKVDDAVSDAEPLDFEPVVSAFGCNVAPGLHR